MYNKVQIVQRSISGRLSIIERKNTLTNPICLGVSDVKLINEDATGEILNTIADFINDQRQHDVDSEHAKQTLIEMPNANLWLTPRVLTNEEIAKIEHDVLHTDEHNNYVINHGYRYRVAYDPETQQIVYGLYKNHRIDKRYRRDFMKQVSQAVFTIANQTTPYSLINILDENHQIKYQFLNIETQENLEKILKIIK